MWKSRGFGVYGSMVLCCMPPPNFLLPLYFLLSKKETGNIVQLGETYTDNSI